MKLFTEKGKLKLFNYVCSLNIYPQEPLLQQQCCIPFTPETRAAARMVQNYNWNVPKQECAFVKLKKHALGSRVADLRLILASCKSAISWVNIPSKLKQSNYALWLGNALTQFSQVRFSAVVINALNALQIAPRENSGSVMYLKFIYFTGKPWPVPRFTLPSARPCRTFHQQ